jgi:hypothetical protein
MPFFQALFEQRLGQDVRRHHRVLDAVVDAHAPTGLRGIIRWWSPNGLAADARFLAERVKAGETAWFYHHGHPANGVHAVNATGVELRT